MQFCSNCGKEMPDNVKFCPYCGAKVYQEINESFAPKKREKKTAYDEVQVESEEDLEDIVSRQPLPSVAIGIYFMLNFILMMGNPNSDEIMGIFIYTWIVLAIIFIRRNKEKPFNWLLNIFVSLQAILVFATGMMTIEYLDAGSDSVGAMIQLGLLVLLLIAIISLLYKGNRRSL